MAGKYVSVPCLLCYGGKLFKDLKNFQYNVAITDQDSLTTSREKNRAVRKRELKEIVGKSGKMELKMLMETVAGYHNDVK